MLKRFTLLIITTKIRKLSKNLYQYKSLTLLIPQIKPLSYNFLIKAKIIYDSLDKIMQKKTWQLKQIYQKNN